jgi:precorrin-6B methylase 2
MSKDKVILLGGKFSIDGVPHQATAILSPIGELVIAIINLETGTQTSNVILDAVAAFDLHEAQLAFYRGDFEEEMTDA